MKSKIIMSLVLLSCSGLQAALHKFTALVGAQRFFSQIRGLQECCGYGCINNCPETIFQQKQKQDDFAKPYLKQLERLFIEGGLQVQRSATGRLEIVNSSSKAVEDLLKEARSNENQARKVDGNSVQRGEKIHEFSVYIRSGKTVGQWAWVRFRDFSAGGGIIDFEVY